MTLFGGGLFVFGQSDVGAEADHAEAGGDALAATKSGTVLEFALERRGQKNNKEIGGGVEGDRDGTENQELKKNVAALGRYELRDER